MENKKTIKKIKCERCLKVYPLETADMYPVETRSGLVLYCEDCINKAIENKEVITCRTGHPVTTEFWNDGKYGLCPICERSLSEVEITCHKENHKHGTDYTEQKLKEATLKELCQLVQMLENDDYTIEDIMNHLASKVKGSENND